MHDRRRRKIRDLEVSGRRTALVWMRRRLSCGNCGERFLEDHLEFEGTPDAAAGPVPCRGRPGSCPSAQRRDCHGLGWHLVMALVKSWSDLVAEHRRGRRCPGAVGR